MGNDARGLDMVGDLSADSSQETADNCCGEHGVDKRYQSSN